MKNIIKLFLFVLITQIFSVLNFEDIEDLNINGTIDFNITESATYSIKLESSIKEKYVYFSIKGNNNDNNYVLSIVDNFENQNRIQLSQSRIGKTKLILSLQQIKDNYINIILECSDYSNCEGTIENKFYEVIPLIENEPIYYYNTLDDMLMEFSIKSSSDIINIWARGELEIKKELKGIEDYKEDEKMIYLVKKTDNIITLNLKGKKGDYINVGFIGYNKNEDSNKYFLSSNLNINGDIITTYLNREIIEEVCYNFDKYIDEQILGYGIIFSGELLYINYNKDEDEPFTTNYAKGPYIINEIKNSKEICFSLGSSNINDTIYSFQLIYSNTSYKLNIFEPNYNGLYYIYDINSTSNIPLISHNSPNSNTKTYYLMTSLPNTYLLIYNCENYPLCSFDDSHLDKNNYIYKVGYENFVSFKKDEKYDFSPISKNQKIFFFKNDNKNTTTSNEIMVLFNEEDTEINFAYTISRYSIKSQVDKYKIDNVNINDIVEIFIEVNIIQGDIDIFTNFTDNEIIYNKNQYINKIVLSFKKDNLIDWINNNLHFYIKSISNSFYYLSGSFILKNGDNTNKYTYDSFKKLITESSNESNLVLITAYNNINTFYSNSFYSPNCEIEVSKYINDENNNNNYYLKLEKYGKFFNEIFHENEKLFFQYKIKILKEDISSYENKKCEIYLTNGDNEKDIIVVENTIEHVMFNKDLQHISYGYIQTNIKSDIIIKFNPKNKAKYIIKIYYLNQKRDSDIIILSDDIIYLNYEEWEDICTEQNTPCYIKIDITLDKVDFEENPEPRFEFSVKSLNEKIVSFIPKNEYIKDYVHYQISQYYYTELGNNEIGFVQLNFLKGSGKVVGKIVSAEKEENNPDWRGYILPTENDSDLKMDLITKKLTFSTENYNCTNKCYLILNVFSDIKVDKIQMKRIYPYSLIIQSYPNNYKNMEVPIISIPIDEYIIGSLENGNKNEEKYDFYNIEFKKDAEKIVFDFQNNFRGEILINIGDNRPSIENSMFKFNSTGKNNIFVLNKEDICDNNLINTNITLAIYSNSPNDNNLYSFIVRLSNERMNDIYRINSEHNTLCNSRKLQENSYQCLYIIEYDYLSDFTSLILYPKSQIKSIDFTIKAKYINSEDYIFDQISDYTNFDYSSNNYLFIKEGFMERNKFILVSIETTKETMIELMTLFYTYNNGLSLNSFSQNILYIQKKEQFSISSSKENLSTININVLEGNGEIYIKSNDKNKFYLKGYDDNLILNLDKEKEIIINEINNTNLIMYIEYNLKENNNNFDEIYLDKTLKFAYDDTNFPIKYFASIDNIELKNDDDYYEIIFNLRQLIGTDSKKIHNFEINAYITDSENKDLLNDDKIDYINGKYDPSLKTGILRISKKDIEKYNIAKEPYLILIINEKDNNNNEKYLKIEIEVTCIKKDSDIYIKNNVYILGLLGVNEEEKIYKLKADSSKKILILQLDFNSDILEPDIIQNNGKNTQIKFKEKKYGNYYYCYNYSEYYANNDYLNLIIKRKTNNNNNDEYFMFKYYFSDDVIYEKYQISNTSLLVSESKTLNNFVNVTINFILIENYSLYDITYIINIISDEKISKTEIIPNFENMPIKELYNPVSKKYISVNLDNIDNSTKKYIQIYAKIINKDEVEFLSYDLLKDLNKNTEPDEDDTDSDKTDFHSDTTDHHSDGHTHSDNDDDKTTLIIVLSVLGFLIIIAIIIIIVIYIKKKGLKTDINKISFQQERDSNLLLKDDI